MSNQSSQNPSGAGPEPAQPKSDTQRLRAVEATVQNLIPRVAKLEERNTDTRNSLDILKAMVTAVLSNQQEIRDSIGIVNATRDAVVELMEKVDGLTGKIDTLACKDGEPNA